MAPTSSMMKARTIHLRIHVMAGPPPLRSPVEMRLGPAPAPLRAPPCRQSTGAPLTSLPYSQVPSPLPPAARQPQPCALPLPGGPLHGSPEPAQSGKDSAPAIVPPNSPVRLRPVPSDPARLGDLRRAAAASALRNEDRRSRARSLPEARRAQLAQLTCPTKPRVVAPVPTLP